MRRKRGELKKRGGDAESERDFFQFDMNYFFFFKKKIFLEA
jgi:hypothetical protein